MGRRSRQRDAAPAPGPAVTPAPPTAPRRRAPVGDAPKAPWHPVPLVELAVLVGLVALVLGFTSDGSRREVLVTAGVLLASLAGLEVSLREHFAGYRSHSTLLALALALAVLVPVTVLLDARLPGLAAGIAAGLLGFLGLRRAFTRRSGGMAWRA